MKSIVFAIILMICCLKTFGQVRLGSTPQEIKTEFRDPVYNLSAGYDKDNIYHITITEEGTTVVYYFNAKKICTLVAVIPKNIDDLNYYIQLYNRQYEVLSSLKWKMHSKNSTANIQLIYPSDDVYYFLWTY